MIRTMPKPASMFAEQLAPMPTSSPARSKLAPRQLLSQPAARYPSATTNIRMTSCVRTRRCPALLRQICSQAVFQKRTFTAHTTTARSISATSACAVPPHIHILRSSMLLMSCIRSSSGMPPRLIGHTKRWSSVRRCSLLPPATC